MCPRLSLCSSPGICQANSVDVQRSMATQGKTPLAVRETSEKEIKCNEHVMLRDLCYTKIVQLLIDHIANVYQEFMSFT